MGDSPHDAAPQELRTPWRLEGPEQNIVRVSLLLHMAIMQEGLM